MDAETIIRIARIPTAAHPLPISMGDPAQPIHAEWIALSLVRPARPGQRPSYLLYFIDSSGEFLETLQWDSMRIALDQARNLARVDAWSRCKIDVPADGPIDTSMFSQYLAG